MALVVGIVLALLSLLHVFWAIVGVSGRSIALPEVDGKPAFQPSRLASLGVALALATAGALLLSRAGVLQPLVSPRITRIGTFGVGIVFLVRAVGDFRLVGFFKRIRGTPFARWDDRLFSPLCLALGLASLWAAIR